jgi:hypothetical protein
MLQESSGKCDKLGAQKFINGRWPTSSHHAIQLNPTVVNVPKNNSAKKENFVRAMTTIARNNKTCIPARTNNIISNLL